MTSCNASQTSCRKLLGGFGGITLEPNTFRLSSRSLLSRPEGRERVRGSDGGLGKGEGREREREREREMGRCVQRRKESLEMEGEGLSTVNHPSCDSFSATKTYFKPCRLTPDFPPYPAPLPDQSSSNKTSATDSNCCNGRGLSTGQIVRTEHTDCPVLLNNGVLWAQRLVKGVLKVVFLPQLSLKV